MLVKRTSRVRMSSATCAATPSARPAAAARGSSTVPAHNTRRYAAHCWPAMPSATWRNNGAVQSLARTSSACGPAATARVRTASSSTGPGSCACAPHSVAKARFWRMNCTHGPTRMGGSWYVHSPSMRSSARLPAQKLRKSPAPRAIRASRGRPASAPAS